MISAANAKISRTAARTSSLISRRLLSLSSLCLESSICLSSCKDERSRWDFLHSASYFHPCDTPKATDNMIVQKKKKPHSRGKEITKTSWKKQGNPKIMKSQSSGFGCWCLNAREWMSACGALLGRIRSESGSRSLALCSRQCASRNFSPQKTKSDLFLQEWNLKLLTRPLVVPL